MGRLLLAIVLVWAVAGVCDSTSRVLLADGLGEQNPDTEKVPSSPSGLPPNTNLSQSVKKGPQTQLDHSTLATGDSEVKNTAQPISPAVPAIKGGPEKKDVQGSQVKLAPPTAPEKKDPPNGPEKDPPNGPEKDPPNGPEKKDPPTEPEKKAPPIGLQKKNTTSVLDKKGPPSGMENNNQHGSPVILSPPSSLETKKPGSGDGSSPKSESSSGKTQVETCDASFEKCQVENLVACIKSSGNALDELFFLIQNTGEKDLSIDVKPTPIFIDMKKIDLAKNKSRKVNIPPASASSSSEIVLNAGTGDCVLHIRPPASDWKHFQQLAAYATLFTPIYGAYLFVFTMVIAGGTWACCKFRRGRRANAGVPYQQLEMGAQTQSNSAAVTTASSADGWEDGWDDDWDEEEAVGKPSDKQITGNISLNGLSSRSRNNNKDGWDVDWDD